MNKSREDEAALAAFYQEHKDDPDIWGEPEEPPDDAYRGPLGTSVKVRFSPEEAAELRGLAKATGMSYISIIKLAVHRLAESQSRLEEGPAVPSARRDGTV